MVYNRTISLFLCCLSFLHGTFGYLTLMLFLICFYLIFYISVVSLSLQYLCCPTRDGTQALGSESTEDSKGTSKLLLLKLLTKSKFYHLHEKAGISILNLVVPDSQIPGQYMQRDLLHICASLYTYN